jgi:hypothetical protein
LIFIIKLFNHFLIADRPRTTGSTLPTNTKNEPIRSKYVKTSSFFNSLFNLFFRTNVKVSITRGTVCRSYRILYLLIVGFFF